MDASVEFLLGNLKELRVHQYSLLRDVENEIWQINVEFDTLNAILKDLSGKPNPPEIIRVWEKEIREDVYDVEDTIHSYITQLAAEKATETRSISFLPFMKKSRVNLAEKIKKLREVSVRPLLGNFEFVMNWIAAPAETRALKKKVISATQFVSLFLSIAHSKHVISPTADLICTILPLLLKPRSTNPKLKPNYHFTFLQKKLKSPGFHYKDLAL